MDRAALCDGSPSGVGVSVGCVEARVVACLAFCATTSGSRLTGARRVVRGEAYASEHAPGKGRPSAALATAALPEDRTNDLTRRPNTQSEDATITVLIPEIVPSKRRHEIVHNQRGRLLEAVLKARTDGVVVATLPLHLHD